ncbi:uncharacterized protein LOC130956973 [Arachis stenosperma]|uniref:uncharacterized protein LOC130956973 n=1 Tax=Arachis stenosperma TaxID=217475 RepID=UPI0025ACFD47|nr:uncharacterized protein LOC130956973 [Arachis stenosperma]
MGDGLVRPFSQAPGQVEYLIVGIDYFTKWIEAEPLASITAQKSRRFIYKNIITRYGIPYSINTDNRTQFTDSTFRSLVASMKIKHQFTSVEHPQANGQGEATNKVILAELKKRLQDAKGAWAEELPQVLWAYRTTPQSAIGETPFRLVYGVEAIIPIEISERSPRVILHDEIGNIQGNDIGVNKLGEGKLAANWKRPYKVNEVLGKGYYKVTDLNGTELPRSRHACNMKRPKEIVQLPPPPTTKIKSSKKGGPTGRAPI